MGWVTEPSDMGRGSLFGETEIKISPEKKKGDFLKNIFPINCPVKLSCFCTFQVFLLTAQIELLSVSHFRLDIVSPVRASRQLEGDQCSYIVVTTLRLYFPLEKLGK